MLVFFRYFEFSKILAVGCPHGHTRPCWARVANACACHCGTGDSDWLVAAAVPCGLYHMTQGRLRCADCGVHRSTTSRVKSKERQSDVYYTESRWARKFLQPLLKSFVTDRYPRLR